MGSLMGTAFSNLSARLRCRTGKITSIQYPKLNSHLAEEEVELKSETVPMHNGESEYFLFFGITGRAVFHNALILGADGMLGEFENPEYYRGEPLPEFERTRQWYFSVDLDLREIQVKSKFLREILFALNRLKIPAPTVEFNSSEGIIFHPLYF